VPSPKPKSVPAARRCPDPSSTPGQRPIFDRTYIHRLRSRMRAAVLEAERQSADWHDLNDQHKLRANGDPGLLLRNKANDIPGIQAAWDAYVFNREQAQMYAAVISAEEAACNMAGREMEGR
jgi:hypothetical protein